MNTPSLGRTILLQVFAVAVMAALAAWLAMVALGNRELCSSTELCQLPPVGKGIYLFFMAAFLLFHGGVELSKRIYRLWWPHTRRDSSLPELDRVRISFSATQMIGSGFVLLFYLFLLGAGLP